MTKRIHDFSRKPAARNYTITDLQALKTSVRKPPKHAYAFGDVGRLHRRIHEERVAALGAFQTEVAAKAFPYASTNIGMRDGEKAKFLEALDRWRPTHE